MCFPITATPPLLRARRAGPMAWLLLSICVLLCARAGSVMAATFLTEPPAIAALRADQTRSAMQLRE